MRDIRFDGNIINRSNISIADGSYRHMPAEQLWEEQDQLEGAAWDELKKKWTLLGVIAIGVFGAGLYFWVQMIWAGRYMPATQMLEGLGMLTTVVVGWIGLQMKNEPLTRHRQALQDVETELSRQRAPRRRPGKLPPPFWFWC